MLSLSRVVEGASATWLARGWLDNKQDDASWRAKVSKATTYFCCLDPQRTTKSNYSQFILSYSGIVIHLKGDTLGVHERVRRVNDFYHGVIMVYVLGLISIWWT